MRRTAGVLLCVLVAGCVASAPEPKGVDGPVETRVIFMDENRPYQPATSKEIRVSPIASDSMNVDWARLAASISYPEFAWRAGIEGMVLVDVQIGPDGEAHSVQIIESEANDLLSEAAERGLGSARFLPAPDSVFTVHLRVQFLLSEGAPPTQR